MRAIDEVFRRAALERGVLAMAAPLSDGPGNLFPEEQAALAAAAPLRQREFATGRRCARVLLTRLGAPQGPILSAGDRRPVWPAGFVGSIAHTRDICVVAVARRALVASVGIDVEDDASLGVELWASLCTAAEEAWLHQQAASCRGQLARALFSAKEATYKCLYPWRCTPFEPRSIGIELADANFRASVALEDGAQMGPARFTGTVERYGGWIFTAMTVPATSRFEAVPANAGW